MYDQDEEVPPQSTSYVDRRPAFIPMLVVAMVALVGAGRMPIEYYDFLRAVMISGGLLVIAHAVASAKYGWIGLGLPMAFLWAPGSQISFDRPVWQLLDVAVAIAVLLAGTLIPAATPKRQPDGSWWGPWAWWKYFAVAGVVCMILWGGISQPSYSLPDYDSL
jgi:hypothetical protein